MYTGDLIWKVQGASNADWINTKDRNYLNRKPRGGIWFPDQTKEKKKKKNKKQLLELSISDTNIHQKRKQFHLGSPLQALQLIYNVFREPSSFRFTSL